MPFGTTLTVLGRTTFKGWINEWHYRESKMLFASLTASAVALKYLGNNANTGTYGHRMRTSMFFKNNMYERMDSPIYRIPEKPGGGHGAVVGIPRAMGHGTGAVVVAGPGH